MMPALSMRRPTPTLPPSQRRTPGRSAALVACVCALVRCGDASVTQLLVVVSTAPAEGLPVEAVEVEVQSEDARTSWGRARFPLVGAAGGRFSLPLSFGVAPQGTDAGLVRVTARARLREGATPSTLEASALTRFVAGQKLLLPLVLDALAHVSLSVDAPDATVRVDGEMAPDARAVELDPGDHTVTVSAPGRVEETFSLMLRAGERVARTVRLRALPARVAVGVTPSDATVYANDVRLGRGAVQWEGDAGPLRLRVARPDYHDLTRTLTLAPGASLTERFDLTRTVRPLHRRPWFWGGVALVTAVVVGATTALVLSTAEGPALDGGSTDTVLRTP